MRKLFILFLLAALMITVTVSADISDDWQYTTDGSEAILLRYIGTDPEVTIPDSIDGIPVVRLGGYLFLDCETVDVFLPDIDFEIDPEAFTGFRGIVWIRGGHETYSVVTALIDRETGNLVYAAPEGCIRQFVEIEDY